MKNQKGLGLIGILIIIGALIITTGGVLVWQKKVLPVSTPTPTPTPIISPTPVEIQPTLPDGRAEKIQAEVYQKFKEEGRALIIVSLYGSELPATEEDRIRQNTEILESTLAALAFTPEEFKLGYKWGALAGFSGAVYKQSALDELENHPQVKSVTLDRPVPPVESPATE